MEHCESSSKGLASSKHSRNGCFDFYNRESPLGKPNGVQIGTTASFKLIGLCQLLVLDSEVFGVL